MAVIPLPFRKPQKNRFKTYLIFYPIVFLAYYAAFNNYFSFINYILPQKLIQINVKQGDLKLCFPYIIRPSYSTNRDLAITSVFYSDRHLPLNLLSIRQSGCKATIVILTDYTTQFSAKAIYMINALDVTVVKSRSNKFTRIHTDVTRAFFLTNYLKLTYGQYDRVFFFDSYDVFFERDIFQYFTEKKVYFFQESLVTINEDEANRKWIVDCYNESALDIVGNKNFVCSGTIGSGSIYEMIRLYTILDAQQKWSLCKVDQGQINYLLYSGYLKKKGLKYHVFNHVGPVLTLNTAMKFAYDIDEYIFVENYLNQTPAVYHQTKNFPMIINSLYKRCQSGLQQFNNGSNVIKNHNLTNLNYQIN